MCILLLGLADVEAAMYFIGKHCQEECEENISNSSPENYSRTVLKLFVFVNLRI